MDLIGLGVAEAVLLLDAVPVVDGFVALAVGPSPGDVILEKLETPLVDESADLLGVPTDEDAAEDAEVFEDNMLAADELGMEGPLDDELGMEGPLDDELGLEGPLDDELGMEGPLEELGMEGPLDDGNGVWPGDTVSEASDLLVVVLRLNPKLVPLKPTEVVEDFKRLTVVEEPLNVFDGARDPEPLLAGDVVIDEEVASEALWDAEVVLDVELVG